MEHVGVRVPALLV